MKGVLAGALALTVVVAAALMLAPVEAGARGIEGLLAPPSACPGGGSDASAQERQMLCLTNFARHAAGQSPLAASPSLYRAALHKDADMLGCDEFSHEACGREFTYWIERFSDCRAAAENIAWGTGSLGGVRAIFSAWMHSPGHRENILGPYARVGIALRLGDLEGNRGAHVWTQDFGASC
jgi:uncharacterized protein YkwD